MFCYSLMVKSQLGVTIIELLIVVTIVITTIAISNSYNHYLSKLETEKIYSDLQLAIKIAQLEAMRERKIVTLCASYNGLTCNFSYDWSQGFIVTSDNTLIRSFQYKLKYGTLYSNLARNKIRFHPNGMTYDNSTFEYIARTAKVKLEQTFVLNQGGRLWRK